MASSISYPYKAVRGTCNKLAPKINVGINNVTMLYDISEEDLMLQVANFGPQVISIYASQNMQNYASGVFKDYQCYSGDCYKVNHAVVLAGYGTDPVGGPYWLVRNSFVSF